MKSAQEEEPDTSRQELRRARMRAVVLAMATVITILFFVYGSIQKTEAEKNYEVAQQSKLEADRQRELAEAAQKKALMLTDELSTAYRSLEECQKKQK